MIIVRSSYHAHGEDNNTQFIAYVPNPIHDDSKAFLSVYIQISNASSFLLFWLNRTWPLANTLTLYRIQFIFIQNDNGFGT